jgi:hypothetical protein
MMTSLPALSIYRLLFRERSAACNENIARFPSQVQSASQKSLLIVRET